ncbi:MAG: cytochrome c maturation protein CcmE [Gemmatimonadota bacterium]
MKKDRRFMVGLVGVAAVVSYLAWTGVREAKVYYLTPTELMAQVQADPSYHDVGVKVSGKVVDGSYHSANGELLHTFRVADLEDPSVTFPVEYRDLIPDTFAEASEVVVEGRFRADGVFEATTVLTKCGSRYEAAPEAMAG